MSSSFTVWSRFALERALFISHEVWMGNTKPFGSPLKRELFFPWHRWDGWELHDSLGEFQRLKLIPTMKSSLLLGNLWFSWSVLLAKGWMHHINLNVLDSTNQHLLNKVPEWASTCVFIFGCRIREPFNSSWFARINWSGRITLTQLSAPQMNSALASINDLAQPLKTW